jgi:hypothetical protein
MHSFEQSAMYNGPDHNQSGFFPWEREMIGRFFGSRSRILVAAAGGGRELIALHGQGFRADGFDCSPRLVETSRRLLANLGIPSEVMLCPPNDAPSDLPMYDALIVGWSAYMHIPGSARRIAFLGKLRWAVPPGAPILVSFWARRETSPDEARTFQLAKRIRSLRGRRAEPLEFGDRLMNRGYYHTFARAEVEAEFQAGGFRLCHYSDAEEGYAVGMRLPTPSVV